VPVTARLSRQFYDRLGEQVTNELVDWFNTVDATHRAELRELNELNLQRLDAKIDTLSAEIGQQLHAMKAELLKWMFLFWAGTALGGLLLR